MRVLIITVLIFSFSFSQELIRDSKNQVVKDNQNSLMWVDDESVIKNLMSHKEALSYCEALQYAGYANWRVPSIEEYELIVDKKNTKNYINKAFKYNDKYGYWASKAHFRTLWFYADYMNFISGTKYFDNRKVNKYVRCVRDMK